MKATSSDLDRGNRTAPFLPPFLKWAGGKKYLLPKILPHLPATFRNYHEPFMGGAALFFALGPQRACLSDVNAHLVDTFVTARDQVEDLILILDRMPIEERFYYEVRASRPADILERAARFIYLNKTCWNGLYRENSKGDFNVPFGQRAKHASLVVCEPEKLRAASKRLQGVNIRKAHFRHAALQASAGDLVYFDPPYTVSHNNNGFIEYNASIFSWQDQQRLAGIAKDLRRKGCHVVISNADHEAIRTLYKDFNQTQITRSSTIASNKVNRKLVTELVISSD